MHHNACRKWSLLSITYVCEQKEFTLWVWRCVVVRHFPSSSEHHSPHASPHNEKGKRKVILYCTKLLAFFMEYWQRNI